jgi:phosphotransferase system enzyme I (PtsI)
MLGTVVREAERRGVRVTMCGEMAAERGYTLLLLGLGIRHFSVAPSAVPEVRRVVRAVTFRRAAEITGRALRLATPEEVDAYLAEEADRLIPDA